MQAQPQSTGTSPEWHFHPLANQLGGFLVAQYISELYRSPETRVKQDPDHLFQKTKEVFLNSGLDELEHLQFRETKLKKLCLDKLWEMTRELNPSHPRFQPEPDPDTENYDWRSRFRPSDRRFDPAVGTMSYTDYKASYCEGKTEAECRAAFQAEMSGGDPNVAKYGKVVTPYVMASSVYPFLI